MVKKVAIPLLFAFASASAQWGDLAKSLAGDFAKEAGKEAGKEVVQQVLGGGNQPVDPQNQMVQPQTVYIQNPNDAKTQQELEALRLELAAMRQQQVAQETAAQKAVESQKLKAIAEFAYDPFDPTAPLPATMPDL